MAATTEDNPHFGPLRAAIRAAADAREAGNHPFGAALCNADGAIVATAGNTVNADKDVTCHAEMNLIRKVQHMGREELERCTMYASTEPCAMCSGAAYWAGIRRVVYGTSEQSLYKATGEYPMIMVPCKSVFATGMVPFEVIGPLLEDEANKVHEGFWIEHK